MSSTKSLTPRLRFPEFREAGPWEEKRLGDVATFSKGKGISKADISPNGLQPCIRYGELYTHYQETIDKVVSHTNLPPENLALSQANDVIIPASGETQIDIATASCVVREGIALGGDLNIIRSDMNGVFLSYYLNGAKKTAIAEMAQGISVVHLYPNQLTRLEIGVPSSPEQQKIADCLASLDDLIGARGQRLAALERHKKGLMQQLFPATGQTTPALRFPEFRDAGPWEEKRLGDVAKRVTQKNSNLENTRVLTNSAVEGIVDQRDYFDKDIANKNNLAGYFVVEKGDYVYNPRVSSSAPVGPIGRNNIGTGIMSPLYTVFRFHKKASDYYEHYFKTTCWHDYIRAVGSSGARHDRMSLSVSDFINMPVLEPSPPEQQKIAACLSSVDDLIRAEAQKIAALERHKKGLMQQLFPNSDEGAP